MMYNSLDHSRVACQQPCTHEIAGCDCACIRTSGIRHVHTCECTKEEVATVNNRTGLLIEFEDQESNLHRSRDSMEILTTTQLYFTSDKRLLVVS